MKIHMMLRLVLCITSISTGIIQANEIPQPQPSLSFGLGSWIRAIFTPNKLSTKQHFAVLGGIGLCGAGYLYFGVRGYTNWRKRNTLRQSEETKRAQELTNTLQACIRNENWKKIVQHTEGKIITILTYENTKKLLGDLSVEASHPTLDQQDALLKLASYLTIEATKKILSGSQDHSFLSTAKYGDNSVISYVTTGNNKGIRSTVFTFEDGNSTKTMDVSKYFIPYLQAKYDLKLRDELRNAAHAAELAAHDVKTPKFIARKKQYEWDYGAGILSPTDRHKLAAGG